MVETDMTLGMDYPRDEMIQPEDLAELAATAIALPNSSSVAEMLVNCHFESML